jgi:hypothetical protein
MWRSLILKNLLAIAIFTLSAFAQDHPAPPLSSVKNILRRSFWKQLIRRKDSF